MADRTQQTSHRVDMGAAKKLITIPRTGKKCEIPIPLSLHQATLDGGIVESAWTLAVLAQGNLESKEIGEGAEKQRIGSRAKT